MSAKKGLEGWIDRRLQPDYIHADDDHYSPLPDEVLRLVNTPSTIQRGAKMATFELTPEQQKAKAERLLAKLQMMSKSQLKNFWDNCNFQFDESLVGVEDVCQPIGADKVELTPAAIVKFIQEESGAVGASEDATCDWDDHYIPLAERILTLQSLLEAMTPKQLASFYAIVKTCPHTQIEECKTELPVIDDPTPNQIMDILATKPGLCGQDDWDCYIAEATKVSNRTHLNN
jgi:hypothetical protein